MDNNQSSVTVEVPRILVVEDGPGEREAMARMLRVEGYEVVAAADVEAALTFLQQRVDMIVSDLRMRGLTGIDLLQQWRKKRPETPFVIVTAYGDVATAVTAMKLGAADFVTKPVDPGRLLELVRTALQRRTSASSSGEANPVGGGRLLGNLPPELSHAVHFADEPTAADALKLEQLTKAVILQTLERLNGNRTRAAEALGISVRTLQRRLKEWNVG